MTSAPSHLTCPHCETSCLVPEMAASDTQGARTWSDGRVVGPLVVDTALTLRCPACERWSWTNDWGAAWGEGPVNGNDLVVGLRADEHTYRGALDAGLAHDHVSERLLRLLAWQFGNDPHRRVGPPPALKRPAKTRRRRGAQPADTVPETHLPQNSWERDNVERLVELLDRNQIVDRLYAAEALRQLSHFDAALELLGTLDDPTLAVAVDAITHAAYNQERTLVVLPDHADDAGLGGVAEAMGGTDRHGGSRAMGYVPAAPVQHATFEIPTLSTDDHDDTSGEHETGGDASDGTGGSESAEDLFNDLFVDEDTTTSPDDDADADATPDRDSETITPDRDVEAVTPDDDGSTEEPEAVVSDSSDQPENVEADVDATQDSDTAAAPDEIIVETAETAPDEETPVEDVLDEVAPAADDEAVDVVADEPAPPAQAAAKPRRAARTRPERAPRDANPNGPDMTSTDTTLVTDDSTETLRDRKAQLPELAATEDLLPVAVDPTAIDATCVSINSAVTELIGVCGAIEAALADAAQNWNDRVFADVVERCGDAIDTVTGAAADLDDIRARLEPIAAALSHLLEPR